MEWRLLSDGDHGAAWNMAVDLAILEAIEAGIVPATLRIYGWAETAVSIGRFQDARRDLNLAYCASHGIPVVRRPTGGRAILHGSDVTVSIAAPASMFGAGSSSVQKAYDTLSPGYLAAFVELGLPLTQGRCERPAKREPDCFQVRSSADLLAADGTKMIGSALRRVNGGLLMQSSIRRAGPGVRPSDVFSSISSDDDCYPLEQVDEDAIHSAVIRGFQTALDITMCKSELTGWEEERAAALVKTVQVTENSTCHTSSPAAN